MSNKFSKYFFIILTIINAITLQGLVQVKMEDTPQATCLLQQGPSQNALQAPQCQYSATGHLKAWSHENLPKGCNVSNTFKLVASLTYLQMLGQKPFGIPGDNDLLSMQTIFNHVYKFLQDYTIRIGSDCPVFGVVCFYYIYTLHI